MTVLFGETEVTFEDPSLEVTVEPPAEGITVVGVVGPPGADGATGASIATYVHAQGSPSTVWVIQHELGYDPAGIVVLDHAGARHHPQVAYTTPEQTVRLTFLTDVYGTAYLS